MGRMVGIFDRDGLGCNHRRVPSPLMGVDEGRPFVILAVAGIQSRVPDNQRGVGLLGCSMLPDMNG